MFNRSTRRQFCAAISSLAASMAIPKVALAAPPPVKIDLGEIVPPAAQGVPSAYEILVRDAATLRPVSGAVVTLHYSAPNNLKSQPWSVVTGRNGLVQFIRTVPNKPGTAWQNNQKWVNLNAVTVGGSAFWRIKQ